MKPTDSAPMDRLARLEAIAEPLLRVRELVRVLRGPGGCAWDRDQTVESMTPYLQEETYEVVEAVAARDASGFREELGDLLFLVLFLADVAAARGWGDGDDAARACVEKLVRRHPHVFDASRDLAPDGAVRQWEELKRLEKGAAEEDAPPPTTLGERPKGLPALIAAFRTSEKAGAVGFQWPTTDEALAKLEEEIGELRREIRSGGTPGRLEDELGDVLYAAANLARYLGIDPERALRGTVVKFTRRFQAMEAMLHARGRAPETSTLEEMDLLWRQVKAESADPAGGA